jgi:hypothetical protein
LIPDEIKPADLGTHVRWTHGQFIARFLGFRETGNWSGSSFSAPTSPMFYAAGLPSGPRAKLA